jgi:hypothetical protein
MLKFSPANSKLQKLEKRIGLKIGGLAIQPGKSCPGAIDCKASVSLDPLTGKRKLTDGKDAIYRCYFASIAAQYPQTYAQIEHNSQAIKAAKTPTRIADLIVASCSASKYDVFRWHTGGDFFSASYMAGFLKAFGSSELADRRAYLYTKSPHFLAKFATLKTDRVSVTASLGGRYDLAAHEAGIRTVSVIGSPNQATGPIDVDDYLAFEGNTGGGFGGVNFHLLIHGTQAAGTWGSRAAKGLRASGIKAGHSRRRLPVVTA